VYLFILLHRFARSGIRTYFLGNIVHLGLQLSQKSKCQNGKGCRGGEFDVRAAVADLNPKPSVSCQPRSQIASDTQATFIGVEHGSGNESGG
jgi:hypothetical protein